MVWDGAYRRRLGWRNHGGSGLRSALGGHESLFLELGLSRCRLVGSTLRDHSLLTAATHVARARPVTADTAARDRIQRGNHSTPGTDRALRASRVQCGIIRFVQRVNQMVCRNGSTAGSTLLKTRRPSGPRRGRSTPRDQIRQASVRFRDWQNRRRRSCA